MKQISYRFRFFILILIGTVTCTTLLLSGTTLFFLRQASSREYAVQRAQETLKNLSDRTESILTGVEQALFILLASQNLMNEKQVGEFLSATSLSHPLIRAVYFIGKDGKTFAVATPLYKDAFHEDLKGIDFSYNPLYLSLTEINRPYWSDKAVSSFTGDTSISVAIRSGETTAIAEMSLHSLWGIIEESSDPDVRVWVVDGRGELEVDTGKSENSGIINVRGYPFIQQALENKELPDTVAIKRKKYHPAALKSEKLGWVFFVGIPAGMDNPRMKSTLADMLLFFISFLLVAIILTPFWTLRMSMEVRDLKEMTDTIAEKGVSLSLRNGIIREFNDLRTNFQIMADKIRDREQALMLLNVDLEQRVESRTIDLASSNRELQKTLDDLGRMQEILVEAEKHAALGRLVAGISHELNTPIGNVVMIVSTLREDVKNLRKKMEDGLPRWNLENYISQTETGLDIAERNIQKSAELVSSFKNVVSNQTSTVRKVFKLGDLINDTLITLTPLLKRSPHKLEKGVIEDMDLDSYPGAISQILTNLISNAFHHAWEDETRGRITITALHIHNDSRADHADTDWCRISVEDNGKGIPQEFGKKIFDPFFTTRMGNGGTGLGLNIAYNSARNILGGHLDYENKKGKGVIFHLVIPLIAPELK